MPTENEWPQTPPSLSAFCRTKLPGIISSINPIRLMQTLRDIVAHDRWNSFDQFHQTSQTLTSAYTRAGAETERYTIPTGGLRGNGKWIIPEALDVRTATLDLLHPTPRRIADFQQCPWHIIQWSAATPKEGLTAQLVVIDSETELSALRPGALSGKLVLTRLNVWTNRTRFCAAGAAGVLSDQPIADCPDAVAWTKFGWGGLDLWDAASPLVGFSISASQGDELRQLSRDYEKIILHAHIDAQRYAGAHDVISGLIPGQSDQEIWAIAHSSEPGALDNASGGAACVEIATALSALITSGQLPRPKRTIRLVHAYECYGFFHYLEYAKRLQPPLAGVCIDTIGARPDLCAQQLSWHSTVPESATFVDDVGAAILSAALTSSPIYNLKRKPFLSTEDTLVGDPKYGFPCPWLTNHPFPGYHSSADTIDRVDEKGLSLCTAAMAAYLYYLANIDTPEALQLAAGGNNANVDQLKRFAWSGDHATVSIAFEKLKQQTTPPQPPLAPTDSRAARIPLRRLPLAPTTENVWPHIKTKLGNQLPKWTLYRADGHRSIQEIADAASTHLGRDIDLITAIDHFEALAELGYIDLLNPADFLDQHTLTAQLTALGLRPGMDVMVHSSMSKIGPISGGPNTVINSLLAVLGPTGTLLAPSFNHFEAKVFNPLTTPTTNGAIADTLWRRPDALRSLHPSHSVAAIGPRAAEYLADHLTNGVWSANSPIGRLVHGDGYILSIGVGHDRTTAYHIAEISLNAPCLDQVASTDKIVDPNGTIRPVPALAWRESDCPIPPEKIGITLDERNLQHHGKVGNANATLAKAIDIWTIRREHLANQCQSCPIKPLPRPPSS